MKYRYILVILIVLVLTGCTVYRQESASTETAIINTERVQKLRNYIDENKIFYIYLTENIIASNELYGTNYAPLAYTLTYDATSITIKAQSVFPNSDDPDFNTMEISLDKNNNIQYRYAYIYYNVFEYYKGDPLEPYQTHLKYYHDSDGNKWLKLNCYWEYFYNITFDPNTGAFLNNYLNSDSYGQKMNFLKDLNDKTLDAYFHIDYNSKIFEQNLNALGWYAKSLFTTTIE